MHGSAACGFINVRNGRPLRLRVKSACGQTQRGDTRAGPIDHVRRLPDRDVLTPSRGCVSRPLSRRFSFTLVAGLTYRLTHLQTHHICPPEYAKEVTGLSSSGPFEVVSKLDVAGLRSCARSVHTATQHHGSAGIHACQV